MLSRHLLRAKIFQALYAFQQNELQNLEKGEKALFEQINRMYDMYLLGLWLLVEIKNHTDAYANYRDAKMLATVQKKTENRKFAENKVLQALDNSEELHRKVKNRNLTNFFENDLKLKLFIQLSESKPYIDYMEMENPTWSDDAHLALALQKIIIAKNEDVNQLFEDYNIAWDTDKALVMSHVAKTIKAFGTEKFEIADLSRDWPDDKCFAESLFRKAVLDGKQLDDLIRKQAKNWDLERITVVDAILLRLALTEFMHFPEIPIKVSLNEYIELAKQYSTPKSNSFVNGILDIMSKELRKTGSIVKTGRGLVD